ncbi:MAG: type II toxin-antitoxin system RelE/ParE family toxin [Candidatus Micrarchaeota archaeon]
MVIKEIVRTESFERGVKSIRDALFQERVKKQIKKILDDPEVGKPLSANLKGERSVRIKPYRIIYKTEGKILYLLKCEHRDNVYD